MILAVTPVGTGTVGHVIVMCGVEEVQGDGVTVTLVEALGGLEFCANITPPIKEKTNKEIKTKKIFLLFRNELKFIFFIIPIKTLN